jgi:hypothetical protein
MLLDTLELNPNDRKSFTYAKAKLAIEQEFKCRSLKRAAKLAVIDFLGGKLRHGKMRGSIKLPNYVVFNDGTKAKF